MCTKQVWTSNHAKQTFEEYKYGLVAFLTQARFLHIQQNGEGHFKPQFGG
jgi:hypothetical protein